jgi:hypothetical protein
MKQHLFWKMGVFLLLGLLNSTEMAPLHAGTDLSKALRRSQYLLSGTLPADSDFKSFANNVESYNSAVRKFVDGPKFYDTVLRYHEKLFGVGLPTEYLEELQRPDIDGRQLKLARLVCNRGQGAKAKFSCVWEGGDTGRNKTGQCPKSMQEPVIPFWKSDITVWVCPSVARACGSNLSRCFVEYRDADEARNTELGNSEAFDSRFTIVKSLSKQAAGLATAVVVDNFPYTKILEPGLSAVDGAIAHLMSQGHHFDLDSIRLPKGVREELEGVSFNDTRFRLIYTGNTYEHAGILTTFGWLRRYEKNRTRANQLYERLLCRRFTADLPRVFPQDPGNLRTTQPCSGCHATLDPLADFFASWGEGGELYKGQGKAKTTTFAGQSGKYVSDLARIISSDEAFATCSVQNVWEWLMGRKFFAEEKDLRDVLTDYFVGTKYSFKELVYAIATHPVYLDGNRSDSVVTDPLDPPPLGKVPDATKKECPESVTFSANVAPFLGTCTTCHSANSARRPLVTEADWRQYGKTALGMLSSGSMPPGQSGPPVAGEIFDFKEAVRCWVEQEKL